MIMALIESAKKQPLTDLYKLVDALIPMVVTDMSNGEIVSLAMEIAPVLSELTVVTQRIPADGEYRSVMIDGMAVLLPDLEGNRQVLVEAFGKP